MNRSEELDRLLADTMERFEDIVCASVGEIEEVGRDAAEAMRRYEEARISLDTTEGRLAELEAEREGLPDRAYRAGLDEDYRLEDELKGRYRELPGEIERLEAHRDRLLAELSSVRRDPAHPDPDLDSLRVQSRQAARSSGAAFAARAELLGFRAELVAAIERATEPVEDKWRGARGWTETVNGMIDDRTRRNPVRR
jgi:chromosome segregation ATPase